MSAHDESKYSWLKAEKDLIGQAIATGKPILGVCLGSQLIADVLGSKVYKNSEPEIGWFPIELSEKAKSHELGRFIPPQVEVFHWHGETFDLPQGALHLASSQACENQAFVYGDRVLGLQFHLETTQETLEALVHGCANELTADRPFIQSPGQMLSDPHRFTRLNQILNSILKELSARGVLTGERGRPARRGSHDGRAHSPGGPTGLVRGPIPSRSLFWGCFRGLAAFFH